MEVQNFKTKTPSSVLHEVSKILIQGEDQHMIVFERARLQIWNQPSNDQELYVNSTNNTLVSEIE